MKAWETLIFIWPQLCDSVSHPPCVSATESAPLSRAPPLPAVLKRPACPRGHSPCSALAGGWCAVLVVLALRWSLRSNLWGLGSVFRIWYLLQKFFIDWSLVLSLFCMLGLNSTSECWAVAHKIWMGHPMWVSRQELLRFVFYLKSPCNFLKCPDTRFSVLQLWYQFYDYSFSRGRCAILIHSDRTANHKNPLKIEITGGNDHAYLNRLIFKVEKNVPSMPTPWAQRPWESGLLCQPLSQEA